MLSLHLLGVFMSFLVLWLSAIAIVLRVLPQMLEILSIAAVRQSCGQVSEFQFIAKAMDVKTFFFFFQNMPIETKAKRKVSEFRKSRCHGGQIWISWLANLQYISGT